MDATVGKERRQYRRYIVQGEVKFRVEPFEAFGNLLNIGQGGICIRSEVELLRGVNIPFGVKVFRYYDALEVAGQVVNAENGLMSIKFLQEPNGIQQLLGFLAQENYPWTGAHIPGSLETAPSSPTPSAASSERPNNEDELEALRELLYQLG